MPLVFVQTYKNTVNPFLVSTDPRTMLLLTGSTADSSMYQTAPTGVGTVSLNSTTKKFENSSLSFANSGLRFTNAVYPTGTTPDFGVDFWIYRTGNFNTAGLITSAGLNLSDAGIFMYTNNTTGTFTAAVGYASASSICGTYTVPLNTWTHVAFTCQNKLMRLFINGGLSSSAITNHGLAYSRLAVGLRYYTSGTSTALVNTLMSNIRFTNYATWTSSFTPPTNDYS
jgi:hypothetical protein